MHELEPHHMVHLSESERNDLTAYPLTKSFLDTQLYDSDAMKWIEVVAKGRDDALETLFSSLHSLRYSFAALATFVDVLNVSPASMQELPIITKAGFTGIMMAMGYELGTPDNIDTYSLSIHHMLQAAGFFPFTGWRNGENIQYHLASHLDSALLDAGAFQRHLQTYRGKDLAAFYTEYVYNQGLDRTRCNKFPDKETSVDTKAWAQREDTQLTHLFTGEQQWPTRELWMGAFLEKMAYTEAAIQEELGEHTWEGIQYTLAAAVMPMFVFNYEHHPNMKLITMKALLCVGYQLKDRTDDLELVVKVIEQFYNSGLMHKEAKSELEQERVDAVMLSLIQTGRMMADFPAFNEPTNPHILNFIDHLDLPE